jgi:hypothetical protein
MHGFREVGRVVRGGSVSVGGAVASLGRLAWVLGVATLVHEEQSSACASVVRHVLRGEDCAAHNSVFLAAAREVRNSHFVVDARLEELVT